MRGDDPRHDWMQQYADGTATAEVTARLETALREDAEFRTLFLEYLNLDGGLAALSAFTPVDTEDVVLAFPAAAARRSRRGWMALAAGLAVLALGAWALREWQAPFATVSGSAGASLGLTQGARVRGETYALAAGSVEFVTARGARVVVEAPAEFHFESAQRLQMLRGKVAADVPPAAKGFTVITPGGEAVDLGTRFGVDVPAAGAAEIHVFQGEVIAKASGMKARQSLRGGEALTLDRDASAARELRSSAFIQPDEMAGLTAGLAAGQRARSEAALTALKADPTLIMLLDFESDEPHDGVFRMVQGRWPGSHAPEFVNLGDHLKLSPGGDRSWPQITLAAWVRIDRLGSPYQSLLHTDGWRNNDNLGQVHWMINQNATMRLALFGNTLAAGSDEGNGYPDSRTPVLPEQGRWVHLATVYDSEQRTVRFYLNGRFDKETRQEIAHPARLGPAQMGNWNRSDRRLSGRIDEFLCLGRAMSDDEVRALFAAGNPYR